ncbi:hypothetical protein ACFFOP_29545 [Sinosporangium siamense]
MDGQIVEKFHLDDGLAVSSSWTAFRPRDPRPPKIHKAGDL